MLAYYCIYSNTIIWCYTTKMHIKMFSFTSQFYKAIQIGLTAKCIHILNYHCDSGVGLLKDSKTHIIFH